MDYIYNRFKKHVLENNLILKGDRILLSLSAGKDSMFMLDLVKKYQNELDFSIGIFHLNHMTRGIETDKDELFVISKSEEYRIRCHAERFDFIKNKARGISFEEHARDIRYALINKICQSECYNKTATAHNMNDNVETVLMRILSGTGISGIKGILPKRNNIIRPVLFAEKKEIYSYLEANGIEWREDLSNRDNLYLRNYLRNIVIPSITERIPQAEENLFNLSDHAAENQKLLYTLADRLYPESITIKKNETLINVTAFKNDIPLIKLFISRVLSENFGKKLNTSIYNEITRRYIINSSNMILYEKDDFKIKKMFIDNNVIISLSDKNSGHDVEINWEYRINPEISSKIYLNEIRKELKISYVNYEFYSANKDNSDIIFLQPKKDFKNIVLRNRRPGDRIEIETGSKKIKEMMIEKKLDSKVKNSIPLIVADNHIAAYLPGLVNSNNNRVACNFHIINDTKRILAFFFRDY